jgi:acyl carrier protein
MNREIIIEVVLEYLNNIVDTFPENEKFSVDEDTVLFGFGSQIDSLSLVSVIVDLEMHYSMELNIEFSLTDDRAMTRKISPFDSVKNLVDYIHELLSETSTQ